MQIQVTINVLQDLFFAKTILHERSLSLKSTIAAGREVTIIMDLDKYLLSSNDIQWNCRCFGNHIHPAHPLISKHLPHFFSLCPQKRFQLLSLVTQLSIKIGWGLFICRYSKSKCYEKQ